jgi:hypothetical protein
MSSAFSGHWVLKNEGSYEKIAIAPKVDMFELLIYVEFKGGT